jgi:hypothetical protein
VRWDHVNDCLRDQFYGCLSTACQLPTSSGTQVELPINSCHHFVGLDILGCENYEKKQKLIDLQKEDRLDEFQSNVQYCFYRGDEVDWWNFHFGHPIERDGF